MRYIHKLKQLVTYDRVTINLSSRKIEFSSKRLKYTNSLFTNSLMICCQITTNIKHIYNVIGQMNMKIIQDTYAQVYIKLMQENAINFYRVTFKNKLFGKCMKNMYI